MSGITNGDVYVPLSGAEILARLVGLGAAGVAIADSIFRITGSSDATKLAAFEVDGFTTLTTRTFTLPNVSSTLAVLGLAQTFSATQTFAGIDASSIGATTRGTILATTLGANAAVTFTAGTASTTTGTGTLVVTGGVGISGALFVGTTGNFAGAVTNQSTTALQGVTTISGATGQCFILNTTDASNGSFMLLRNSSSTFGKFGAAAGAVGIGAITDVGLGSSTANTSFYFLAGNLLACQMQGTGSEANVVIGSNTGIATNATDGFLYITSCAGAPSGTPTAFTNRIPIIYDRTNNFLYVYNGGWKKSTVYA